MGKDVVHECGVYVIPANCLQDHGAASREQYTSTDDEQRRNVV